MVRDLTEKQRKVLDFITKYQETHGFPPSIKEIMEEFSLASPRTARDYLLVLERKGAIRLHEGKARGIELLSPSPKGIPLVGRIPAGTSEIPFEEFEEYLPVDPDFFGSGTKFAVRVRGDSMTGVGIHDGDLAVIRKQPDAENGQIVAALVGGEVTLKRIKKRADGGIELHPENSAYRPMVFQPPELPQVLGVYIGLIRRS